MKKLDGSEKSVVAMNSTRTPTTIDLGTSEDDVAARKLYESCGFTNREGAASGPIMYVYERELGEPVDEGKRDG